MKKAAPWGGKLIGWTTCDRRDPQTLPRDSTPVICCDELGRVAVCSFDSGSGDFFLCLDGFDMESVREEIVSRTLDSICEKLKLSKKVRDHVFDAFCEREDPPYENECNVEFSYVYCWMPLPTPPECIGDRPFEDAEEQFAFNQDVFRVVSQIEPLILQAILFHRAAQP